MAGWYAAPGPGRLPLNGAIRHPGGRLGEQAGDPETPEEQVIKLTDSLDGYRSARAAP